MGKMISRDGQNMLKNDLLGHNPCTKGVKCAEKYACETAALSLSFDHLRVLTNRAVSLANVVVPHVGLGWVQVSQLVLGGNNIEVVA